MGEINGENIGIIAIKGAGWTNETLKAIKEYVDTEIAALQTDLDNATDGLGALKALIDAATALIDSTQFTGPMSYLDAGGEQTVRENIAGIRRKVWLDFSNRNMTQAGTFRIYRKVDGANYDLYAEQPVTVGAGDERAFDAVFTTNQDWKLTYEEDVNEGAARAIPYNVIMQEIE